MGSAPMSESGDAGFHSVAEKCPRPTSQAATRINEIAPAPHASTISIAAPSTHAASVVQTEARYRASFSRTRQKRGRPSFDHSGVSGHIEPAMRVGVEGTEARV